MLAKFISLIGVGIFLTIMCSSVQAGVGDCDPVSLTTDSAITTGACINKVSERCIRRVGEGVRVTCDSGEVAISVFCEQNGTPAGNYSALVTAGIIGRRTGACLWSSKTDGTIIVGCRAVAKLKHDFSGDRYSRYQRVPKF
jgi:hypothetical protein